MWKIHIPEQLNYDVASSKALKSQKKENCGCAEQFSESKTEELDNYLLL